MNVPTNDELAERAKDLDAHTVVRNWLERHTRPQRHNASWTRDELDDAADNFLADPEIAVHLHSSSHPVTP